MPKKYVAGEVKGESEPVFFEPVEITDQLERLPKTPRYRVNSEFMRRHVCGKDTSLSRWLGDEPRQALDNFFQTAGLEGYERELSANLEREPVILVNRFERLVGDGSGSAELSDKIGEFYHRNMGEIDMTVSMEDTVKKLSRSWISQCSQNTKKDYFRIMYGFASCQNAPLDLRTAAVKGLLINLKEFDCRQRARFKDHVLSETLSPDKETRVGPLENPYVADYLGSCIYSASILEPDKVADTLLDELENKVGGDWYRWRLAYGLRRTLSYGREAMADPGSPPPETKTFKRLRDMLKSRDNQLRGYASFSLQRHLKRCDNFSMCIPILARVDPEYVDGLEFRNALKRGTIIQLSDIISNNISIPVERGGREKATFLGETILEPGEIENMRDFVERKKLKNMVLVFQQTPGILYRGYLDQSFRQNLARQEASPHRLLQQHLIGEMGGYKPEEEDFKRVRGMHMRVVTTRTRLLDVMSLEENERENPEVDERNRKSVNEGFGNLNIDAGRIKSVRYRQRDETRDYPSWHVDTEAGDYTIVALGPSIAIYEGGLDRVNQLSIPLTSQTSKDEPGRYRVRILAGSNNAKGVGMIQLPIDPESDFFPDDLRQLPDGLHTVFYHIVSEQHVPGDPRSTGGLIMDHHARREMTMSRQTNEYLERARQDEDPVYLYAEQMIGGTRHLCTRPVCMVRPLTLAVSVDKGGCGARSKVRRVLDEADPKDEQNVLAKYLNRKVGPKINRMIGVDVKYLGRDDVLELLDMPEYTREKTAILIYQSLTNTRIKTADNVLYDPQHWRAFYSNRNFMMTRNPLDKCVETMGLRHDRGKGVRYDEYDQLYANHQMLLTLARRLALMIHITHDYGHTSLSKSYRGGWHSPMEEGNCGPTGELFDLSIVNQPMPQEQIPEFQHRDYTIALDRIIQTSSKLGLDRNNARMGCEEFLVALANPRPPSTQTSA